MEIKKYFLTESEYTRSKEKIEYIDKIVITSSKYLGFSALKNRNIIEGLKNQKDRYFSCHYIIDQSGEVISIIPDTEKAYCTQISQFDDSGISILLTLNRDGDYMAKELITLNNLIYRLMKKYNIDEDNVIMEYDANCARRPVTLVDEPILFNEIKKKK